MTVLTWMRPLDTDRALGLGAPQVLEDTLQPLVHNVLRGGADGAISQVQAFEGKNIT